MAYASLESNLLFIVGLQKSGTSPLLRLLRGLPGVLDPFPLEGRRFWGDDPPFRPAMEPSGRFYSDRTGHEITAAAADATVAALLAERLAPHLGRGALVVNKNPYNSVRIPWLRTLFPNARIVALFRAPCDNVYSLLKKFHPLDDNGLPPEDGWWGVKPAGWMDLRDADLMRQLSLQWAAVNKALLANSDLIDTFVEFEAFCANPAGASAQLHPSLSGAVCEGLGALDAGSGEYLRGGPIVSRNRLLGPMAERHAANSDARLAPLDAMQIAVCRSTCEPTWSQLKALRDKQG